MQIVKPSWNFTQDFDGIDILRHIEYIGRTCYKSHDLNEELDIEKTKRFIKNIITRNHESVLEHQSISIEIITDRAIMAEITRHRMASFAIESQRFCNYSKDKYNKEVTFVLPSFLNGVDENSDKYKLWKYSCTEAEQYYLKLLETGCKPEEARSVLPNSTKTHIQITANLREWRHIFKLRTSAAAHPDMRILMRDILQSFQTNIPIIFDDIKGE